MTPPDLLIPTPSVTTTPNLLGIKGLHLTAYKSKVNVGSRITITCVVIGGPDNPNITWTKGENLIGLSHRTKVETRKRHSNLTIRDVMAKDAGRYRCQARAEKMRSRYIDVWVLPVLGIRPRKVTKRIGEQATFHCSGFRGFRGANVSIVEVTRKESEVRYNKVSFTATTLQIPQGKESHVRKFVCEISSPKPNFVKRSEVAELTIVSQDSPRCPGESLEGVSWSHTVGGGMDEKPCPNGATGTASRKCSQEGAWKKANFAGCSSAEFNKLNYTMEAIVGGFQSDLNAQQVLAQLANASRPKKDDSERPPQLYGGDLMIAVDILAKMAQYNAIQGSVSSTEDLTNYAKVASNLLDSTNNRTWKELEKAGQAKSQILVKAMDDYGFGISATFNKTTESMVAETKNLAMSIFRVDEDSPLREEGIKVAYKQSSIYLPPQAFSSSSNSRIVTLVYLTLNDVLPLALENTNGDDQPLSANTTIVSAAVDPRPPDMLNKPVKIVLQNRKTSASSGANPQGKCVFWRPEESAIWNTSGCRLISSESEVTMTTCECDHLTIFAALMDPYGTQTTKALEIISIVGCSISLLAVLITMTFTLCFWRALKSPRAKVLLNLCVAIAITCALAIFEGLARKKAGCPVVAALLHYFLLALFSWMLCEGILHYLLLVKVFGGGAGNKLKYFYMLGWGFPAVMVTISLAVTQANGYGNAAACWLDVESGLIWAFIAPALLVIVINIVVFVLVIRQMMGSMSMKDKTQIERVGAGVKASAVILPLLGITWLFGLLSFSSNTNAFKYIFAIFNSLQGLMIFIFHCVLNKQVQDAIKRRLEKGNTGFSSNTNSRPPASQNAKLLLVNPPAKKAVIKRTRGAQYDDEQLPQTREVFKDTLELNTLLDKKDINRVNEEEPLEGSSHTDE